MQSAAEKPPFGLVYDSDLGQTIDSVLALALLHGLAGKQQCRIASLTINCPDLRAAQLCDSIERFYASATGPGLGGFVPAAAPIGIVEGPKNPATPPVLAKPWESKIAKWNDTAIPELLIRNSLMAQYDGNAIIVATGTATNLDRLLKLTEILPLLSAKVKLLVLAGGRFTSDAPAARRILAAWPTPIVYCGPEVGDQFPFPGAAIESAFAYVPAHPIAEAYRAAQNMPYDASGTALAAMLYAIKPIDGYFGLSESGTLSVSDAGHVDIRPAAKGQHRLLKADPAQRERILKIYVEMASAKPVAPPPRRLPPALQQQLQQEQEKKPEKQP
jgi:hypothetical protein